MELPELMTKQEVLKYTGMSVSNLYLQMSQGTFPKSIRIAGRSIRWLKKEVYQWLSNRVNHRNEGGK